jgi:putative ribosome biogenesis GTPase RsgA
VEPDCAVRSALQTGGVDATRYASYQKLLEEATLAEKY